MARTAVSELQQQIEEVRREAFAAGYAAAMEAVRELASGAPVSAGAVTAQRGRRAGMGRKTRARARRGGERQGSPAKSRRSAATRPRRGGNAQTIEEILQAAAPRALRQVEIREALKDKGLEVAFTSIRHALGQLERRNAAEQVGNTNSWRHSGGGS